MNQQDKEIIYAQIEKRIQSLTTDEYNHVNKFELTEASICIGKKIELTDLKSFIQKL